MKYDTIIENLENIIENWYDKEALKKFIAHPEEGLCDNIRVINSSPYIPDQVFMDWVYDSGSMSLFPVGGLEEYESGCKEPYSLFNNPKRLHLAVHMLQWFRYHNVEE